MLKITETDQQCLNLEAEYIWSRSRNRIEVQKNPRRPEKRLENTKTQNRQYNTYWTDNSNIYFCWNEWKLRWVFGFGWVCLVVFFFQNWGSVLLDILIINVSDRKSSPFRFLFDRITTFWQQRKSDPSICRCSRWISVNGDVRKWLLSTLPAILSLHSDESVLTTAVRSHHAVHEESNDRRCPKYSVFKATVA